MRSRLAFALVLCAATAAASCQQILGLREGEPEKPPAAQEPAISVAAPSVDFGLSDCGAAPSTRMVTLQNTGTAALQVTASLGAASIFSLMGSAKLSVAPGASASIAVAAAVPQATAAGSSFSATLTLASNDPAHPSVTVPISATAQGATLTLGSPLVSFGEMAVGFQVPSVPVTLTNGGNAAVQVSLGTPADGEFSGTYTGAPAAVSVAPGTALPGLSVSWTPADDQVHQSSIPIVVKGAVCGVSAAVIPVAGQGTTGSFTSSTTDLFFGPAMDGNVPCGTTAASRQVTLGNAGNMAFSWTGTTGAGFSVSPSSGTVPAKQMVTLTVTPVAAIPAQSATTTDLYADMLSITTDVAGDLTHVVTLHETAQGAILAFGAASLDFGGVAVDSNTPASIGVTNTGNAPANVALATTGAAFGVTPAGPTAVAAGGSLAATATFSPGDSMSLQTGVLSASVGATDVLCAPLPMGVPLSGTGLDGVVGYSPSAVNFGTVDCGAAAAPQDITFTNTGNSPYTITATLGLGAASPYTITLSPVAGVVAPGGTATLTLTPAAVPFPSAVTPNLYGDLLTVTSTAVGDAPHYIPISETAGGAILTYEMPSIDFGTVDPGTSQGVSFALNNVGNEPITLGATVSPSQYVVSAASLTLSPGGNFVQGVTFNSPAGATQTFQGDLTFTPAPSASHVLCQPLPAPLVGLTATNVAGSISLTALNIVIPPADCGTQPSTATFSTTTTFYSANASLPAGSSYSLQLTNASHAAGTFFLEWTVIPKPIPATSSTLLYGMHDVIQVTLDTIPAPPARHVFVHSTARGAVLSFNEATAALPPTTAGAATTANGTFYVLNTGNVTVPSASLSLSDPTDFTLTPTAFPLAPFSPVQSVATFGPPTSGMKSGQVTLVPGPGPYALCAPVPSALALTGTGQ